MGTRPKTELNNPFLQVGLRPRPDQGFSPYVLQKKAFGNRCWPLLNLIAFTQPGTPVCRPFKASETNQTKIFLDFCIVKEKYSTFAHQQIQVMLHNQYNFPAKSCGLLMDYQYGGTCIMTS
jgi:hypothetical protein